MRTIYIKVSRYYLSNAYFWSRLKFYLVCNDDPFGVSRGPGSVHDNSCVLGAGQDGIVLRVPWEFPSCVDHLVEGGDFHITSIPFRICFSNLMLEVHDVPNSRGLFQDVPEFRQQLVTEKKTRELQIIKISTVVGHKLQQAGQVCFLRFSILL